MMNNLFSSFDVKNFFPLTYFLINMYFFIMFSKSSIFNQIFLMNKFFLKFFYDNINKIYIFYVSFIFIFFLNFLSLNLYLFNLTSQTSLNMVMILMLWTPIFVLSITKKKNSFLNHLVPLGTVNLLIPMMVLIELLSFFMRPLTLFLRLSINMIAGHVLVSLISNIILNFMVINYIIMYMYMIMKFLVSFIQAYIICTLLTLYIEEIYVKY